MGFGMYSSNSVAPRTQGIEGRKSVKRVFVNRQLAHVWAQQEQDEGRTGNGNFYFRSTAIYSYRDNWPLAQFTGQDTPDGLQIVLVNSEKYSVTTSAHSRYVDDALRGLPGIKRIDCDCEQLRTWRSGGRQAAAASIVNDAIRAMIDSASAATNAKRIDWTEKARRNYETSQDMPELSWEERRDRRIAGINDERVNELMHLLGVSSATSGLVAYDIPAMREAVRVAFNTFYEPTAMAKREKARDRRAAKALFTNFRSAFRAVYFNRHYVPWSARRKLEARINEVFRLGTAEERASALRLLSTAEAHNEQEAAFNASNPDAAAIVRDRTYGRNAKRLTPAEWQDGKSGQLDYSHASGPTMVRRKGETLQTSRGAEAPFGHAVAIYLKAQACRASQTPWKRNGETMRAGHFQLDAIDTQGNISIGCHRIAFDEMQRLAVREVPKTVRACYPLPALV